nr:hypothetical protein [Skermanella sp. TT6]
MDANGIPLAVTLSAANIHDSRMLEATVDAIPPIRQCAGRPRRRPAKLHAGALANAESGTKAMISGAAGVRCADAPSFPGSRGAASTAPSAWAGTAGRSNAPWMVRPIPADLRALRTPDRYLCRLQPPRRSPHHLPLRRTMVMLGTLIRSVIDVVPNRARQQ